MWTTVESDRADKVPAYGRAGVPEMWLLNLPEKTLEIYREPNFTGYSFHAVLRAGQEARPLGFPDAAVDVAALLHQAQ